MIDSPLKNNQKKNLTSKDIPLIKHNFIKNYGYDCWKEISLSEFFDMLPVLVEEVNKQETLRIVQLKSAGVKNPK